MCVGELGRAPRAFYPHDPPRLVVVAASLVVIGLLVHANTLVGSSHNAHLSALRAGGPSAVGSSTAAAAASESPQAGGSEPCAPKQKPFALDQN